MERATLLTALRQGIFPAKFEQTHPVQTGLIRLLLSPEPMLRPSAAALLGMIPSRFMKCSTPILHNNATPFRFGSQASSPHSRTNGFFSRTVVSQPGSTIDGGFVSPEKDVPSTQVTTTCCEAIFALRCEVGKDVTGPVASSLAATPNRHTVNDGFVGPNFDSSATSSALLDGVRNAPASPTHELEEQETEQAKMYALQEYRQMQVRSILSINYRLEHRFRCAVCDFFQCSDCVY